MPTEKRGRGGGKRAFSSTMEVGEGGWSAVMVGGCLLRSLLRPILHVTAGGTNRV